MITIACVYKTGPKFNVEYVDKLYDRLFFLLDGNFKFVCLTDSSKANSRSYRTEPLVFDLPGWWSKMELFRDNIYETEYVLYFDLDTLFMSDIDRLVKIIPEEDFMMLRGFNSAARALGDPPASGIMSWKVNSTKPNRIYSEFFKDPKGNMKRIYNERESKGAGQDGDQGFIGDLLGWDNIPKLQDYLPRKYIIGKKEAKKFKTSPPCHIVAWSGNPPLHEVANSDEEELNLRWVKEKW